MSDPFPYHPAAGYPGRGVAVRFQALADLGTPPRTLPTPPPAPSAVPAPSAAEGDLPFLSLAEAASRIRVRKLSPVELTRAYLARIERLNPALNAYVTVTGDLALAQARELEAEIQRGRYRGPLHGIPMAVKDLIATRGVLTTGGTAALSDWVPSEDAEVWRRLREAGAVLLGKTGLHEMAYGFTNLNPFYGPTRNPWDITRITGGSSGGSGAAVAASLCAASIGSDTAGSIRVPSALCGITGLKPTFGLVSTRGAIYLSWSLDHLGPMARTAEDAALVLNAIAGHDRANPLSAAVETQDYAAHLGDGLAGLRLAVPSSYFWEFQPDAAGAVGGADPGLDPEVARATRNAIATLRGLGAAVEEVALPALAEAATGGVDLPVEAAYFVEELPPERRALFSRQHQYRIERGLAASATAYLRRLERTQRIQAMLEGALRGFDAFVLPTTPIVAPTISAVEAATAAWEEAWAEARDRGVPTPRMGGPTASIGRCTAPFNQSGQPALSVPCGVSSQGLPIGLMIAGSRHADATVLRIGHTFQRATDWHTRRPPVDG